MGGVDLPAGTTVMVLNGAANRDPRRFDDPATFDVDRPNARQHLAFGRGIHTCPGAPAGPGRGPGEPSSGCWTARPTSGSPSASTAPPDARRYRYLPTFILRGLTRLHLEFTLAGEEGR